MAELERRTQFDAYRRDPCAYASEVLRVAWWSKQQEIARLLLEPPYKVLVKASQSVGKSYLAGGLTNWWYDTFEPSAVITTAPTREHVQDVLWREVRQQRGRRGGFAGPRKPELGDIYSGHYAKGMSCDSGESFQGRHLKHMLFIFDEAVRIAPIFWEATKGMFDPGGHHAWLAIFNPTDTSSQAYQEEFTDGWHVVTMSALDHPNITAALASQAPPYPGAVSLGQVNEWVRDWCTPIASGEARATDLNWPPQSECWYRPGPLFESRALGRWPSSGTYGVWSDLLFGMAESALFDLPPWWELPEIGCDPARFGDDFTAIHVRWGRCSMHHERHNGWDLARTAGRLKQLCIEWAAKAQARRDKNQPPVRPEQILVKIDEDGMGGGVVDQAGDYAFVGVSASAQARHPAEYPNTRSELWFHSAGLADTGALSLARLDRATLRLLRRQCLAPEWKVDAQGRCQVESKDQTKKRLSASPDDADGMNLAYWPVTPFTAPEVIPDPTPNIGPRESGEAAKQGLFGKRKQR